MLRLQKLELIGFKSFFSRTEFLFDGDITAIVGPNGCGKSNVGDALNWVIGEQSVKSLRGDRMEDVIFNGSEGRKPLGMAEVSLHLKSDSGNGSSENVVITRRLFRSGESEYMVNGQRSRLRDMQELLARIHIGSGVYAIIGQGKIDAALSSRPRERRLLLEEAAGIALYKTRKRQAETKLQATEENLLRVNDIVTEVERQIRALKRQAAKARRYERTVGEIKRYERILFFHEHRRLTTQSDAVDDEERVARDAESRAAGRLATLEAEFEENQRLFEAKDDAWRKQLEQLHALDREMDQHERDVVLARQQAKESSEGRREAKLQASALAKRLEAAQEEIRKRRDDREALEASLASAQVEQERLESNRQACEERIARQEQALGRARAGLLEVVDALSDTRNRRQGVHRTLESIRRRIDGLGREHDEAREELSERSVKRQEAEALHKAAQARVEQLRAQLRERTRALRDLERTLADERSRRDESRRMLHGHEERLRALEEMEASNTGTRELLTDLVAHDGVLADGLKVDAQIEVAVDVYLSRYLDAAIVKKPDQALKGIASLKRSGRGRAGFLPISPEAAEPPVVRLPEDVAAADGFVGRLAELVKVEAGRARALAPALARAVVVRDLAAALQARRRAPFFDYITLEGDIVHVSGLIEGGASRPEGVGMLTRRRARANLLMSIETQRTRLTRLEGDIAGHEAERTAAAASLEGLGEEVAGCEKELVALQHRVQTCLDDEARARDQVVTVGKEIDLARGEADGLERDAQRLGVSLGDLEGARQREETRIESLQREVAEQRRELNRTAESLSALRASLSGSAQRLEALDAELARLLEADQELRDLLGRETARESEQMRRFREAEALEQEAARALAEKRQRREELSGSVREGEVSLGEERIAAERRSGLLRESRSRLEEARAAREQVTLEKERLMADLRHLESSFQGDAGEDVASLTEKVTAEERELDIETARTQLGELRGRRDRIGPVNMMALDQFRELEERYAFLSAQRQDLAAAVASLKETIARINRTSRERFMAAFNSIRTEFNELFRLLFGGGRADLRLLTENGDDVLDCGLEIVAQPPGKRLQSVMLLSGGEKAMTAIALLFGIFRYRPSPFCLLDEVDAPLDEANVLRFRNLLKSMSQKTQFVLITHNRGSMESADVLYGITMDEPGISHTMSVVFGGADDKAKRLRTLPAMLSSRHKGNGRRSPARTAVPQGASEGVPEA